ncbi:unnamed protein product [Rhodiola kirilowii]
MANTSAGNYSDRNKRFEYQVFLSFRGPDTRTFVGHLRDALDRTGFRVFLDNLQLEYGKDIQQNLYEAIHQSEESVVILSPRYADSRWCLDELVKIMELQALNVHRVLPVFFDVEPTVVRNQIGVYKDAFSELEKRFEGDRIEKWKSALKRVANLRGLSLNADRNEPLLVENIIQELRKLVNTSRLYVPRNIVGRDCILDEINMWLQDGSSDVEVGLISGLGGIGKSTVAKIAYNDNKDMFHGCSLLADFTRKTTQFDGISCLLEQVYLDVTGKPGNKIHNVDKSINEVYLLGDHLAKWFNETITEAELLHTVPDNQLDIRALNLGFMASTDIMELESNFFYAKITIKNLTWKWEWTLNTLFDNRLFWGHSDITLTWLSHWHTMEEHREIKPGDLLHISVDASGFGDIVTWGIKIIYEEQQQVDEDGSEQHDDDNVRETDKPWSSRSQTVNYIDKTTTSLIDGKSVDQEEEEDGSTSVSNRYNNIFCSPLDLSVYEYKEHSDDDDEDLNHKPRVYIIPASKL